MYMSSHRRRRRRRLRTSGISCLRPLDFGQPEPPAAAADWPTDRFRAQISEFKSFGARIQSRARARSKVSVISPASASSRARNETHAAARLLGFIKQPNIRFSCKRVAERASERKISLAELETQLRTELELLHKSVRLSSASSSSSVETSFLRLASISRCAPRAPSVKV